MENEDANNWTKLGDAVRGIVDRLEVTTARPPLPVADALLLVRVMCWCGPPVDRERGVPLSERGSDPVEGGAS
jgi:hypothetical protein